MSKKVLMACLGALTLCSEASAITFTSTQFDVNAVAVTSGVPGFDTQSGPPAPTPVSASADSSGGTELATAGAIGGPGLLSTSADVSGGGGVANAAGSSHFLGSFTMSAAEPVLKIVFDPLNFASGSGLSTTSLFVLLSKDGVTLFSDLISAPWSFSYNLGPGGSDLLDLTLTSEVSAGFPGSGIGNASSSGLVTITSAVPLPATWLLFLIGLGPVAAMKKRAGQAFGLGA